MRIRCNLFLVLLLFPVSNAISQGSNVMVKDEGQTAEKTITYLISKGYIPLPCKSPGCSKLLWKKVNDKEYSDVYQIGESPYFREVVDWSNIAANKKSKYYADQLIEHIDLLPLVDSDKNYVITESEVLKYNRGLRADANKNE